MAQDINTGIKIVLTTQNVGEDVQHKTRSAEIEEIPAYLVATPSAMVANLSMIIVQEAEPGVNARSYPWLKLDAQGYPDAAPNLYIWRAASAAWVAAAP